MNVTFGSNQKGTEEMTPRVLELEILHTVTSVQFHCFTFVFRIKLLTVYIGGLLNAKITSL